MAEFNKKWVLCMLLPFLQALQMRSLQQNVEQLETETNTIQKAWDIIEQNMKQQYDIPEDMTMIQTESGTDNKFLGTALWDFFDLVTFGAFEKKPKKHHENNSTQNSNTTQPQQMTTIPKDVKVAEQKDHTPEKKQPAQNGPSAQTKQPAQPTQIQPQPQQAEQQPVQPKPVAKKDQQQVEPEVKFKVEPDVTQGPGDHPSQRENAEKEKEQSLDKQIKSISDYLKDDGSDSSADVPAGAHGFEKSLPPVAAESQIKAKQFTEKKKLSQKPQPKSITQKGKQGKLVQKTRKIKQTSTIVEKPKQIIKEESVEELVPLKISESQQRASNTPIQAPIVIPVAAPVSAEAPLEPTPAPVVTPAATLAKEPQSPYKKPEPQQLASKVAAPVKDIAPSSQELQKQLVEPEKEKFTEQDIADVPFTPRQDDALDQSANQATKGSPRSPLPGGAAPLDDPVSQSTVQKSQPFDQIDSLRQKFNTIKENHSRNIDSSDIDEIFHSYSHLADGEGTRELTITNAEQAQQELFRKWDIDLTDNEQRNLNEKYVKTYFDQLREATGENTINVDKSEEFFRGITAQVLDTSQEKQNVQMSQEDQNREDQKEVEKQDSEVEQLA